jgi:DNA-binding response OmpR family regulator
VLPEPFVAPASPEEIPDSSPEEAEGAPADAKRETLLIVDDDAEIRNYLCEALGEEYATIAAADGEEAWQLLEAQSEPVALVVADVMMPRIDGLRLCSMIKHNVGYCHIPVVLLTAKVEQGEQLDGLNAGADDYICKPFVLSLLRAKIRNIIRGRKLAIANYAARPEAAPTSIATNTMDEELLSRAVAIVESNIDNEAFTAEQLARDMGMSRSNLHLKLKGVTGESAVALIRRVRLGRACRLLKEGRWNVAEISAMVGLSPAYFSTTFKKYMGCHPSEYAAAESDKTK